MSDSIQFQDQITREMHDSYLNDLGKRERLYDAQVKKTLTEITNYVNKSENIPQGHNFSQEYQDLFNFVNDICIKFNPSSGTTSDIQLPDHGKPTPVPSDQINPQDQTQQMTSQHSQPIPSSPLFSNLARQQPTKIPPESHMIIPLLCSYVEFLTNLYDVTWTKYTEEKEISRNMIGIAFFQSERAKATVDHEEQLRTVRQECDELKSQLAKAAPLDHQEIRALQESLAQQQDEYKSKLIELQQARDELANRLKQLNSTDNTTNLPPAWVMADAALIKILEMRENAIEYAKKNDIEERKRYIEYQLKYAVELSKLREENHQLKVLLQLTDPVNFPPPESHP